jgi:hypothetical protein
MHPSLRDSVCALLCALTLASCGGKRPNAPAARPTPRVDHSLTLPGNDGRVHLISIPSEAGEVTRCIVAVTSAGASTSCAPRDIELPPEQ